MAEIAFRRLEHDDLPRLYDWLGRAHVRRWYAQPPGSFAEVVAKYGPRAEEGNTVKSFIVRVGDAEQGYIQAYPIEDFPDYEALLGAGKGTLGMDLFIADELETRRGLGPRVIRRFVDEIVFGTYGALACVAGPVEGDRAAIRAFEKAGFSSWKTVTNERGEREHVMRLDRDRSGYRFETIDLLDADTCVRFHRDMYVTSFGTTEGLDREMGVENAVYLRELRRRIADFPEGNAHVWHDSEIVGQLEMRRILHEPHVGYVSLVYVVPAYRRRGVGRAIHEHAAAICRERGMRLMRLSVATSNVPAMVFYRKLGWVVVGQRPNVIPMVVMEFALA
jgi:ribosomal protein S18 acetylase RimI-like enzyme